MSHIVIDGYNLLAQSSYASREDLLAALKKFQREQKHKITIFFDGTHEGTGTGDRYMEEYVQIIFSPLTVTADEMMEEFLEKNHTPDVVIVSSDRRIQKAASAKNCSFLESKELLTKIKYSVPEKKMNQPWMEGRIADQDNYSTTKSKKGNPRKKSKKEKKKAKALRKV